MNTLMKLLVAFCVIALVSSIPVPQDEAAKGGEVTEVPAADDAASTQGGGEPDEGAGENVTKGDSTGAKEESQKEEGGQPDAEGDKATDKKEDADSGKGSDRVGTFNKVLDLVKKATGVDQLKSDYFRSYLNGALQTSVRNPLLKAVLEIGNFSKIQGCFSGLSKDVQDVVSNKDKEFADCNKEGDQNYACSTKLSETGASKLQDVTSKIVQCISSKSS